ncbi:GNAT family N-acetyltransferase [Streptomyces macrosporus]|uniref:GNAT family N-acetyltransferase n=1 Tax=Streptomyces macrosporus TaxID=44032 RepID=A0ABP5XL31_9ACTN
MGELLVRPVTAADRATVAGLLAASWGGTTVVGHGTVHDASALPALLAERDGEPAGLLTYTVTGEGADRALEIVTLDAVVRHTGVGSALLAAAVDVARKAGARRVWLITTNDNLDALRFYQRRGMRIVGVSPGAVDEARALKPSIPLIGDHGIELHDELVLELRP